MDLTLLQGVSYIIGALGVCVAAFYYVLNLRETTKIRRISFTNSVMQQLLTEDAVRNELDCYTMQWNDYEDYKRKYHATVNPDLYGKRLSLWYVYDSLGYLYKSGLIDLDTVAHIGGNIVVWDWLKFKPIIEEDRKTKIGPEGFSGFEYLAEAVLRVKEMNEPDARARYGRMEKEYSLAQ